MKRAFVALPSASMPIEAGCGMRLKEHQVACMTIARRAEEVIEAGLENLGDRRIARDVSAELAVRLIGANDHRQRIPADDRGDALLERQVPRIKALILERDRVAVGGERLDLGDDSELARVPFELLDQKEAALFAHVSDDRFERVEPFAGFRGVGILERL